MTPFKYQNEIQNLPNCPPANYQQVHLQAFRWVFEDDHHPNNFRPSLVISPRRRYDQQFIGNDRLKCAGYALSFFNTREHAKQRYLKLMAKNQRFPKLVGTHLVAGMIDKNDGVASKVDSSGHFELHEFAGRHLALKFRGIGPITMEIEEDGIN